MVISQKEIKSHTFDLLCLSRKTSVNVNAVNCCWRETLCSLPLFDKSLLEPMLLYPAQSLQLIQTECNLAL